MIVSSKVDYAAKLAEQRQADWVASRTPRLREMHDAGDWIRRRAGESRLGRPARHGATSFRVTQLSDPERKRFFRTIFPRLAQCIERAWQDLANAPYQRPGWGASPFRASEHAELVKRAREYWITELVNELAGHDPDPQWLATWGGHLPYSMNAFCRVLSAAIDLGGQEAEQIVDVLRHSAGNSHDVAVMGDHVISALQGSSSPDAWNILFSLLRAAGREEGLRQSIMEGAHRSHPGAFRGLLRVIESDNLTRFASTVQAVNNWFGFMYDSMASAYAHEVVAKASMFLESPDIAERHLDDPNVTTAYLALWCVAYYDAPRASRIAMSMLKESDATRRWVAVHCLDLFALPETNTHIIDALGDEDICVAARACDAVSWNDPTRQSSGALGEIEDDRPTAEQVELAERVFDRAEQLLRRVKGKKHAFTPLVFPWARSSISIEDIGTLLAYRCPPSRSHRLIPIVGRLDPGSREQAIWAIAGKQRRYHPEQKIDPREREPLDTRVRATLISHLSDAAKGVRIAAAECLSDYPPDGEEIAQHEDLLGRTASDVRTRAIERILALDDAAAIQSALRLISRAKSYKTAGIEILEKLIEAGRSQQVAAESLAHARGKRLTHGSARTDEGRDEIARIEQSRTRVDDAFGLAKPFAIRPAAIPRSHAPDRVTAAAVECIWSLNDLIEANKTHELRQIDVNGQVEEELDGQVLLGSSRSMWRFGPDNEMSLSTDRSRCPILDLLDGWLQSRTTEMRDADGFELCRARVLIQAIGSNYSTSITAWPEEIRTLAVDRSDRVPQYAEAIDLFLRWALRVSGADTCDYYLNQLEGALERGEAIRRSDISYEHTTSETPGASAREWLYRYRLCPGTWEHCYELRHVRRVDALLRAASEQVRAERHVFEPDAEDADEPLLSRRQGVLQTLCPSIDEMLVLWYAGEVSDDELLLRIVEVTTDVSYEERHDVPVLRRLSSLFAPAWWNRDDRIELTPRLRALVEMVRKRVIEIELERGDAVSPATHHALALAYTGGAEVALPALARLGTSRLVRSLTRKDTGRSEVFTAIVVNSKPGDLDSLEAFEQAAKRLKISPTSLIDMAMLQPRWASHIEHTLNWPGLEEGILWLRAHTTQSRHPMEDEERGEMWEARASEHTAIPLDRLSDGVVDRAWFERCYAKLGPKRWEVLYDAAKYASSSSGHTRARLFADAMLGEVTEKELVNRIESKRHQDAARALGLLSISPGDAGRKQVLARYKVLQEMRRTSRKHGGSMLQASEKRAVEIAMENLAWTAGYPDPLRLQWAMEIEELGDLAKGPVSVKVDQTEVTLAIDDEGTPSLTAIKAGKSLKSVPPAIKKDKRVAELAERLTNLRRQGSRIRLALESAMCRGDTFAGDELATLFTHPLLKSALSRLVLVGMTTSGAPLIGYPDKNGKALRHHDASIEPLKASDALRIAHPLDLLATKQWSEWQSECFKAERVQPFKQIFREIYTPIASELATSESSGPDFTRRYAGQQVQPRQALALFASRGWVARPEEGVQRTFHHERVTVHVEFEEGFYTPAEIDGLTLAGVSFAKAGTDEALRITDVPPRVFSEVMRDLDLVVSVAHRGEVDPEASQSTVEMRAALLKETCALLSLANVRIEAARAIIKGDLGEYALHLASGTIHKLPGGTIWVVPVHSQHRGRIFLPFADDDPKTAEIISKVLLLARDREIKDPAILAQIRAN